MNIIKFKAFTNAVTTGETVVTPIFRKGLFEQINATQWKLQLNDFGQSEPTQFDNNADNLGLSTKINNPYL